MMLHKTNDIKSIMQFYRAWLEWDKDRAIEDWLSDFDEANFQRQKSKAALLGAILFQSCRIDSPRDIARAKKILALLSKREFHYIIKTYADVFVRGGQSAEGQAFKALVEKCGYKLTDFK
jgi:hypothetical protein